MKAGELSALLMLNDKGRQVAAMVRYLTGMRVIKQISITIIR